MKISPQLLTQLGRWSRNLILLTLVAAGLPPAVRAQTNTVTVAGSFVEPLQFITVDTRVDNSSGTTKSGITYVLGRDDANNAYLRKYDPSGAVGTFKDGTIQKTIAGIKPAALAVLAGTTNLYIVGGGKVFRVDTESGQVITSLDAGSSSGLDLKSAFCTVSNLYLCGNFTGPSATIWGKTATLRGTKSGIVIELSLNLSASAQGLITFGGNGSGALNTANAIAVDENGDMYVAGKLGAGTFQSDVFNAGLWSITRRSGGSVGSLAAADSLLNGVAPSSTAAYMTDTSPGTEYVYRATGTFFAPAAGNYTFTCTSDDGQRLKVDGAVVVIDDNNHPSTAVSGTVGLSLGLHSIEYVYFNHGGGGSCRVQYTGPGVGSATDMPAADLGSNKGYVVKFGSDFASLKGFYSSENSTGTGGEISELTYSQGFIYGVGNWIGNANNPAISPADASSAGSSDIEVLKLDTGLLLKARATVKGALNNTGYSLAVDESGGAYITGSQGPQSVDFFGNGDPTNHPFATISSAKAAIFVAQLDSNFTFKWVNVPNTPVPDFNFTLATPRVRWHTALQRLFWTGYFDGTLFMGNPNTVQTLNGPESFLAVLDPDGKYTERVLLTILSQYGVSGVQVLPFGGQNAGTNDSNIVKSSLNTQPVIKGAKVTASVPAYIYRNLNGVDITTACQADPTLIDSAAETRIGCTGYSVGQNVANGIANSYTFTISQDSIVKFNWNLEHSLRIRSDFSETEGKDPGATGHIIGLKSDAAGSPAPSVEKHWVAENSPVIAAVDAFVDDQNYSSQGLAVRYVATGYDAAGPANTLGNPAATNFIPFVGNDTRRQVSQFLMTGPASITYHWKLKIGVQVATTGLKSTGYPYVHVVSDPGQVTPPTQTDGIGSGTFYYDESTSLQIGSIQNQDTTQLKGWFNGDGTVFPNTGSLSNLVDSFVASDSNGSHTYADLAVANLNRPARVMWDYGDRIFDETVFIGNTVTFATVDDPAVRAKLRTDLPPIQAQVLESPQGTTANDIALWDSVGKKYYPLRPGVMMTYWQTTGDPNDRVIIRLTFKYPVVPHYRHIANTRGVPLDPSTNDSVAFVVLKYAEPTTGAAVDANGNFTTTGPGMTVLQFSETSSFGRGGSITTPRIRVVQSANWNDNLPNTQPAIIGKKITSSYDTAGLGTGYLFFQKARHNAAIYNRNNLVGPIIPVNLNPSGGADEQLVVVWYEKRDKILWPYQAVRYQPAWPVNAAQGLNRIVIASRYGNESVAADGTDQLVVPAETYAGNSYPAEKSFNPARFSNVQIYNQPVRTAPGYNPNEEHALLAPSLRSAAIAPQPPAVYALRNGDLNVTNKDTSYTSDPYVLVQFFDNVAGENRMAVYNVVAADSNRNLGSLNYDYKFEQEMEAGEPVIPFYPLPNVIGATPSPSTYGKDGNPTKTICFWKDHKSTGWAVSGDSFFTTYYFYPLLPDFWWPTGDHKQPGDFVAFLPNVKAFAGTNFIGIDYTKNDQTPAAQGIKYTTVWPLDVPILKVGETLTFPGGEYRLDNPTTPAFDDQGNLVDQVTPGLPGVVGFAAGQVVFDTMNPTMDDQKNFNNYTTRIFPALEERTVPLAVADFPTALLPVNKRTTVKGGLYIFNELPSSLQKRMFYDPIRAVIGIKGYLNDKDISDATLTAAPPAVYVLEPNVITLAEKNILDGAASTSPFQDVRGSRFTTAMDTLFNLTRNPNQLDQNSDGVDTAYRVGLEQKINVNPTTGRSILTTNGQIITESRSANKAAPMQALGPGLALVANPNFLDPNNTNVISYVTLAENNSDTLGSAPVALHIIKVDKTQRYRGSIKSILSANVFDENIVLRHTGDFGGNADDLVFEWWYRPEDGTDALPPDREASPSPWKLFADPSGNAGTGFYQLTLKGNPSAPQVLLGDTWFFCRYRHVNEVHDGVNWEVPQPNNERRNILGNFIPGVPYDWAGAGNSSPEDLDGNGQPDYLAQLAEGWVKRVLTAVNPYEARIRDFTQNAPATYSSIIQQIGAPYAGPVALNSDKNVIENVGLIALYQTILNRAEDLSINLSTPITDPVIANALELASTRLSDFYMLLGNEAYSDSQNPAISFGSGGGNDLSGAGPGYGAINTSLIAFQNQLSSRLDEELGLLRGQKANSGTPVFNRLYWNFTHAEGEAAYVMKYNISDINNDGFIDVKDAMTLYPQGHGDAWGHYLTSIRLQYDLLRHPYFNWVSRSEFINSQDVVIPVDYLDERKFAQVAAAKAQAGVQILNLTYRQKFVADPRGQWQGYLDTDPKQAWGVDEWAHRAGQGALFDWITANALLPAVHPNTNYTGIQKVDRTTVTDISTIAGNFTAIQEAMDQVDHGNNPLGLHNGALSFAVDLTGGTFFQQTYAKALTALSNAKAAWDNANAYNNSIRQTANTEQSFRNEVYDQDISYRNQLIEIFGTPYQGVIGSGKLYAAGYQGPDTALFNYVNVNNVNESTVPKPSLAFVSSLQTQTGSSASIFNHQGFVDISSAGWQTSYNLSVLSGQVDAPNYADFASNSVPTNQLLQNLNLPVMASGYSYVAPASWGQRGSAGELQKNIADMVQAQADLAHEINVWQQISADMINKLTYMNQKFEWDNTIDNKKILKGSLDIVFDTAKGAADLAKTVLDYLDSKEKDAAFALENMIPTVLPTGGLAISPGDALSPARGSILLGELVASGFTEAADVAVQAVGLATEIGKAISDLTIDTQIDHLTAKEELLSSLYEIQTLVKQEADQRLSVFKAVRALDSAGSDYRTTLANGVRLMQERETYNKRVAAQTQQNRYADITFRFARNAALEKYRSSFDLASRYAYLAASAYDYDLNLGADDPGSPLEIMADIVRQRSLGFVDGSGNPQVSEKGLAEDLAKLRDNYDVLSSRMGLINPIQESQILSLRYGFVRALTDATGDQLWHSRLQNAMVTNLWAVPQFRRYCRSFAPESAGPQPGLVIPFTTTIRAGQNVFGFPLGAGDVSYDPSVYSTRIASVAAGFSGYDGNTMASTPRVYLVPVGSDVMTIPNSAQHDLRFWNVIDQKIPVPYPATTASFSNPSWRPFVDSVTDNTGTLGDIRKYSSFMANTGQSIYNTTNPYPGAIQFNAGQFPFSASSVYDSRLSGRSVWNTQWLLIIPGAALEADSTQGLQDFIKSVDDIQLNINTYGYSGN